jgi:hypothetical protein
MWKTRNDVTAAQLHAAEERERRWRRFLLDHLEYCSDPSALELSEDMERELAALRETPATEGAKLCPTCGGKPCDGTGTHIVGPCCECCPVQAAPAGEEGS